jgi:hypothetical protein
VKAKTLLAVYGIVFSVNLYAENCTHFPEGISKYRDEKEIEITVSVAKSTLNGSQDLAESEARVDAKSLLLKEPFFEKDKKLMGVIDTITCVEETGIFAAVKVSEESIKQARELDDKTKKSIENAPTPEPKNLPNQSEVKSEFDRLMFKQNPKE